MEGVTHAYSDADKGQGTAATTKTSGNPLDADQAINEFLRSTERVILPVLVKLYNAIFNQGIFPEEWTKSIIVPLH